MLYANIKVSKNLKKIYVYILSVILHLSRPLKSLPNLVLIYVLIL